jgi:single-strand DNA-binding protein
MSSVNKVIVLGRVGKDPEIKKLPDGTLIATFSVATSDVWTDKKTGERKEKTEWHKIAVLNDRLTDIISKYVRKGSQIMVEGQLQTRKWNDGTNAERSITEIILGKYKGELTLLDSKNDFKQPILESSSVDRSTNEKSTKLLDDEMPF